MKPLVIIPARGGSKGIPGKNIRDFFGKPLIQYSIDLARKFAGDERICVSTDSDKIISVVEAYGLKVPFKRPAALAADDSGMTEVITHAIAYYNHEGIDFDKIILLQPTSPFRTAKSIRNALDLYDTGIDMVVSVCEATANPYYVMVVENENKLLDKLLNGDYTRRQDTPKVYQLNGAIYIINPASLQAKGLQQFERKRKVEMTGNESVDIDTETDWLFAECLVEKGIIDMTQLLSE